MAADRDDSPRATDTPGKVVGRRRAPGALTAEGDTKANVAAWRRAFPTPFVPKGVYRFKSHEEADEWLWTMLSRRRQS
jgi:hypothetical protein